MTSFALIREPHQDVALSAHSAEHEIWHALPEATSDLQPGSVNKLLQQIKGAASPGPLLCSMAVRRHGVAVNLPDFDQVNWHEQAVASLATATVLEDQAEDLKAATAQLQRLFLPGYQKNQLQHCCRAMSVLLRCLKFCLTSEGQQAVLAAIICLVSLQIFVNDAAALQAITKEAGYSMGQNRSGASQLAAWAVTSLTLRSKADCHTIALAGGSGVLVNQLQCDPLKALEALGQMAESHPDLVWDALLSYSGLTKLVDQTKTFDLRNQEGLTALGRLIMGLHKLVQHPHNQAAVLEELRRSETLELCFICAKSGVDTVSKPAMDCLVLIWQWYLRKSPSASFSLTQMSCFLPEAISATAGAGGGNAGVPEICRVHGKAASPTAEECKKPAADVSQLWSVTPVIDFACEKAVLSSPEVQGGAAPAVATQWAAVYDNPVSNQTADSDHVHRPVTSGLPPLRAPPPPTREPSTASQGSSVSPSGSRSASQIPPFSSSFSSRLALPSSRASSTFRAFPPASPLLGFAAPRVDSAAAELTSSSALPVGGGEFQSSPRTEPSTSSSSFSTNLSSRPSTAPNPGSNPKPTVDSAPNFRSGANADPVPAFTRHSLKQQSALAAPTAGPITDSLFQRHSMSTLDPRRSFSSCYSPFSSRSIPSHQIPPSLPKVHVTSQQTRTNPAADEQVQCSSSVQHSSSQARAVAGSVLKPSGGSAVQLNQAQPSPAAPSSSSAAQGVQHQQPDSLQFIQSWLDTNPEGHWPPFPFAHHLSPVKATPERLNRQAPTQQLPSTPEGRMPTQRVLQFSPQSVTQPGAEVLHAETLGKIRPLEDAYLSKRKLSNEPMHGHEDSAWGSFDPQVAWSASASSLVTTVDNASRLESRTSCDTRTHTGDHSITTVDNMPKPYVHSSSRLSLDDHNRSPVGRLSMSSLAQPRQSSIALPSRTSLDVQNGFSKGKKWSRFLTWLTDPDTRDAARAKKHGRPLKKGPLYDLATPIGRCPV